MKLTDNIEEIFARNIRELREGLGLSQANLAELASLSTTSIYRFEAKERWPKPENVQAIATALGCAPSRLFASGQARSEIPPNLIRHIIAAAHECGLKVTGRG